MSSLSFGGGGSGGSFGGPSLGMPTTDPVSGLTVPTGDPGAIESAAQTYEQLGHAAGLQVRALRTASHVAIDADGGWRGSAAAAYAELVGHVTTTNTANAGALHDGATALRTFGHELSAAQSIIRRCVQECDSAHASVVRQQGLAVDASDRLTAANNGAAAAVHPAQQKVYEKQASDAHGDLTAARTAQASAQGDFDHAQSQGRSAEKRYADAVTTLDSALESAAATLRAPQMPAAGAPVPISVTPRDVALVAAITGTRVSTTEVEDELVNPSLLARRTVGPITPGLVIQLLKTADGRAALAKLEEDDKPLQGGLTSVVPGLHTAVDQSGQFLDGAWNATKGTVDTLTHPAQDVKTLLQTSPLYWQIVRGENPVTAAASAQAASDRDTDQMIDLRDFEHGRVAEGLGDVTATAGETKIVGDGLGDYAKSIRDDPGGAVKVGVTYANNAGVTVLQDPASDIGETLGNLTPAQVQEALHDVGLGPPDLGGVTDKTLHQITQLPQQPRVVYVPKTVEPTTKAPTLPVRSYPRAMPRGR